MGPPQTSECSDGDVAVSFITTVENAGSFY